MNCRLRNGSLFETLTIVPFFHSLSNFPDSHNLLMNGNSNSTMTVGARRTVIDPFRSFHSQPDLILMQNEPLVEFFQKVLCFTNKGSRYIHSKMKSETNMNHPVSPFPRMRMHIATLQTTERNCQNDIVILFRSPPSTFD